MKQVIIRLKDCRTTYRKTLRKCSYYSVAQYKENCYEDFSDILPGQELEIKVGNKYVLYISYEEIIDYMKQNNDEFDDELYYALLEDWELMHYIKEYLPKY